MRSLSLGFYIGGVSAGGTLTAIMAQRWISEGCQPPLTGAWVSVSCVLEKEIVPEQYQSLYLARDQNARSLIFNQDALEYITKVWHHDRFSPDFSPFQADNPHKGMPPVYIQVAGKDPLRDDGLIYEKALRAHGVKTKLDVYPGLPHGFEAIFRDLEVSRKSMMDTLIEYRICLRNTVVISATGLALTALRRLKNLRLPSTTTYSRVMIVGFG